MKCEGYGTTMKAERMVTFCTELPIGKREYFPEGQKPNCSPEMYAHCKARLKALKAQFESGNIINFESLANEEVSEVDGAPRVKKDGRNKNKND